MPAPCYGVGQVSYADAANPPPSEPECIRSVQVLLNKKEYLISSKIDGTWNAETSKALLDLLGPTWPSTPGGPCALLPILQPIPTSTVPAGIRAPTVPPPPAPASIPTPGPAARGAFQSGGGSTPGGGAQGGPGGMPDLTQLTDFLKTPTGLVLAAGAAFLLLNR